MNLEENIRKIVVDELSKLKAPDQLVPIAKFCAEKNISRTTLWRSEREGRLKLVRIGRRVFINPTQL